MSHHQLIYCTKKVKWVKLYKQNNVFLRSIKHYPVNVFPEELQKVNFSNYEHFSCIDVAYTGFLNKLIKVTNEIPANKDIRIKNNTQKLFELTHARDFFFFFFFLMFKKTKFHIGEENYKKVNSQIKNLVSKNKREFYETNLRQKVNKPNFEKS